MIDNRPRSYSFSPYLTDDDSCVIVTREYDTPTFLLTGCKVYDKDVTVSFSQAINREFDKWDDRAKLDFYMHLEEIKNKYLYEANTEETAYYLKMNVYKYLRNYRYDIL